MPTNTLAEDDGNRKNSLGERSNKGDLSPEATIEFSREHQVTSSETKESGGSSASAIESPMETKDIADQQTIAHEDSHVADSKLVDIPSGLGLSGEGSLNAPTIDLPTGASPANQVFSSPQPLTKRSASKHLSGGNRKVDDSAVGTTIGNYEILSILGRGGMGVVYKARHTRLNRIVALKMILHGLHGGSMVLQRFIAEAQSVAALQHPGIVQIFEIAEHEGLPYFSLEFVDGKDLHSTLKGTSWRAKPAAELLATLCDAMQYAHDRQIMHRDIKPANILMDDENRPKISDFGLAKKLDAEDQLTRDGAVVGTPSYMAPEQARGDTAAISARSDIYSLGAVLYQLLTGRAPFMSDSMMDTLTQVIHRDPVQPRELQPGVPIDLETICVKALQKEPNARYQTCSEMAADLRRFLNGEPILARPVSRLEHGWRWCKRNPKIAIPSALAVLFVVLTAFVTTWAWRTTSAQAVLIAQERDEAQDQKKKADEQRAIAVENEEKANREKEEAERQRILANEAKNRAEANRLLAEKQALLALQNIQFFITEIDNRLAKEPGMTNLRIGMMEVLEKKWEELDVSLTGGIQGEAIPTQMRVRELIADAWFSLGRIKEADARYEKIMEQGKQRVIDKNRSDASRLNMAFLCNKWANIRSRLASDPAEAEQLRSQSIELLRDILKDPRPEPDGPKFYQIADSLQQALMKKAASQLKLGALEESKILFEEVLGLNSKVLTEAKDNAPWFTNLPNGQKTFVINYFQQNADLARTGAANILCRLGLPDQAIPIYEEIVQSRRANVEKVPNDLNAVDQLANQLRNYGQQMIRSNRVSDAVRLLGLSHDAAKQAYESDPMKAAYKRSYGYSLYYWGVALHADGKTNEALALFERSRALRQELVELSQDKSSKIDILLSEARLGNAESAEKWIVDLASSTAKDADLKMDIARAWSQIAANAKENTKREESIAKAFSFIEQAITDGLADPFVVTGEWDLAPLREDDRWNVLIARLKEARSKASTQPK